MSLKNQAAALIRSFNTTAQHLRAGNPTQRTDAQLPGVEQDFGSIPIKMNFKIAPQFVTFGVDAKADVLAESDVREDDFLIYADKRYRVADVLPVVIAGETIMVGLNLKHAQEASHG